VGLRDRTYITCCSPSCYQNASQPMSIRTFNRMAKEMLNQPEHQELASSIFKQRATCDL
jgi:hypothetical protein